MSKGYSTYPAYTVNTLKEEKKTDNCRQDDYECIFSCHMYNGSNGEISTSLLRRNCGETWCATKDFFRL